MRQRIFATVALCLIGAACDAATVNYSEAVDGDLAFPFVDGPDRRIRIYGAHAARRFGGVSYIQLLLPGYKRVPRNLCVMADVAGVPAAKGKRDTILYDHERRTRRAAISRTCRSRECCLFQ